MFEIHETPSGFQLCGHADAEDPLEGSIEKWETIVAFLEKYPGIALDDGADLTCPLCQEYEDCDGCPVKRHTRAKHCYRTPYYKYHDNSNADTARAEVNFLRMLQWKASGEKQDHVEFEDLWREACSQ